MIPRTPSWTYQQGELHQWADTLRDLHRKIDNAAMEA